MGEEVEEKMLLLHAHFKAKDNKNQLENVISQITYAFSELLKGLQLTYFQVTHRLNRHPCDSKHQEEHCSV